MPRPLWRAVPKDLDSDPDIHISITVIDTPSTMGHQNMRIKDSRGDSVSDREAWLSATTAIPADGALSLATAARQVATVTSDWAGTVFVILPVVTVLDPDDTWS